MSVGETVFINGCEYIRCDVHDAALADQEREHYHDLSEKDRRIGELIEEVLMLSRELRKPIPLPDGGTVERTNIEGTG